MYADDIIVKNLQVAGGHVKAFPIRVKSRGVISKAIVVEDGDDSLDGFTYRIVNKATAAPATVDATPVDDSDLYTVVGPCTVASGARVYAPGPTWCYNGVHGLFVPYQCLDAIGVQPSTNYFLYLVIAAEGSGAKTFHAAITIGEPQRG